MMNKVSQSLKPTASTDIEDTSIGHIDPALVEATEQAQAASTISHADNAEGTLRSGYTSPEPSLVNDLASGVPVYIPDSNGNPSTLTEN